MRSTSTATAPALVAALAALSIGSDLTSALPYPNGAADAIQQQSTSSGTAAGGPITVPLSSKILSSGITDLKDLLGPAPAAASPSSAAVVNAVVAAAVDDAQPAAPAQQAQLSTLAGWTAYLQQKYGEPVSSSSATLGRRDGAGAAAGESLTVVDGWSYYVGLINVGGLDHEVFIDTGSSDLWMYKNVSSRALSGGVGSLSPRVVVKATARAGDVGRRLV